MTLVAKSDQGTGNHHFASYVMSSNDLKFAFTAPYSSMTQKQDSRPPVSWFDVEFAHEFHKRHGLAVRALGLLVEDSKRAFEVATQHGATAVQGPVTLVDDQSSTSFTVSEVSLYGDVVLRFVSGDFAGPYLPGYEHVTNSPTVCYGLQRLDHAVGNVPKLLPAVNYIAGFTGFHEFAEFVAEDVGTVDSGLNSMVLANNSEMVLLPVNEPTFGTKRKSQIQTYLEQNEGSGLQHLALKTDDIFCTLREMRSRADFGGFDFMPRPSDSYYKELPQKIGDVMTKEQFKQCEELGILVDKDDQGVLLQIFTKPLGDRPTVFIEIIQRLCMIESNSAVNTDSTTTGTKTPEQVNEQVGKSGIAPMFADEIGGCGGFGKGNFSELFKSIEVYESDLGIN